MDPEKYSVFEPDIQKGFEAAGDKNLTQFDVSPFVTVIMGDDVDQCMMPIRANMALYIGGMGARDKNFYNNYAKALGFEETAVKIQDLFLSGKKDEAAAAVPSELIDACHLVGPAGRIKERLDRWKAAASNGHVGAMLLGCQQPEALEMIAGEML
jgi:alkanesulfonate monooxygenase SsuD/methylene tetrahydromethanopterin reductase-like flavin-dependent oxidoreductase (luciferase family)